MQKKKEKLTQEKFFEEVSKNVKVDKTLVEDLGKILEGLGYNELVDKVGKEGTNAQVYLAEHPDADKNLHFTQQILVRLTDATVK